MSAWRAVAGVTVVGALLFGCAREEVLCDCAPAPRGCVYTGRASCPCAAMVCSDVGPLVDQGSAVTDAATVDAGVMDVGAMDVGAMDVAVDRAAPMDVAPPDVRPTDVRPTDVPPTDVPPTDVPPTDVPRRDVPAEDVGATCDPAALAIDRSCTSDSQCRAGIFTVNCCGTARAIGYNVVSGALFELLRDGCDRIYGGVRMCGCPTLPTELDDGTRSLDHDRIMASCVSGRCSSHLRP